uniref:Uncharacterized protein n=1 Tax=viral metagenome TaxID=1070528 RepID=A0A6C0KSS1_9ZZZZ
MTRYCIILIIIFFIILMCAVCFCKKSDPYIAPTNYDSAILYFDEKLAPYLLPETIATIQKGVTSFFSPHIQLQLIPACDALPKDHHGLIVINFQGKQLQTPFGKDFNNLDNETRTAFGDLVFTQLFGFPSMAS